MVNPDSEAAKLAISLRELRQNMPALIDMQAIKAQLNYAAYKAYVTAGFNEHQALALVLKAIT